LDLAEDGAHHEPSAMGPFPGSQISERCGENIRLIAWSLHWAARAQPCQKRHFQVT
jgi:hypothetical protein